MDKDFEKTLALLGGKTAETFSQEQLSDTDKAQIDAAIDMMFSGLSLHNWLAGGTLGQAWSGALDSVREFVFSFTESNPVTNYARVATYAHRRKWHVQIVSSLHASDKINCPPEKFAAWQEEANAKIQDGVELLRSKIANFQSCATPCNSAHTFTPMMRETILSRTIGERENVHEREHTK